MYRVGDLVSFASRSYRSHNGEIPNDSRIILGELFLVLVRVVGPLTRKQIDSLQKVQFLRTKITSVHSVPPAYATKISGLFMKHTYYANYVFSR